MHERQLYKADIADESPPERLTGDFNVKYINEAERPHLANRFLVTMVNPSTGDEKLLDLLIDGGSFRDLATEVRKHFDFNWEIFEWFDPDVPF